MKRHLEVMCLALRNSIFLPEYICWPFSFDNLLIKNLATNALKKKERNSTFEYQHSFIEYSQMLHLGILEDIRIQPRP